MPKWKRNGVLVVCYRYDHDPKHVHVYEDGKQILKFDIESWTVMSGILTSKAKKTLQQLKKEGLL